MPVNRSKDGLEMDRAAAQERQRTSEGTVHDNLLHRSAGTHLGGLAQPCARLHGCEPRVACTAGPQQAQHDIGWHPTHAAQQSGSRLGWTRF